MLSDKSRDILDYADDIESALLNRLRRARELVHSVSINSVFWYEDVAARFGEERFYCLAMHTKNSYDGISVHIEHWFFSVWSFERVD